VLFRVKIAGLSVLISGAVLLVFGLLFLTLISRVGMDRIDREILTLGESQLHVWHPRQHWQDFARSLRFIYGKEHGKNIIIRVTDPEQQFLYKSPHWPQEVTAASFPAFDFEMITLPGGDSSDRDRLPYPGDTLSRTDRERLHPPPLSGGERRRPPPPPRRPPGPVRIKKPFFITQETSTGIWRTGILGNQHITIMIGMDLTGFYEDAGRFKRTFLIAVPLALLLLAGGGWLIAHRALKPVALITRTAERITARGLDQRIPTMGADAELLQLIRVINNMLDRLEKSFGQAVRFSADAAHELQTPLTILQGVLDDAVQHSLPDTDEQRRYSSLLEEVQHLKNIIQKLLILARADADQLLPRAESVDLSVMVASVVEDAGIIAPHLSIETHILPQVIIQADPDLVRRVIQELTTNAVKYNTKDGLIRFRLTVQNNTARFSIANTGAPIPDKEQKLIFDRFYRIDKSRTDRVSGSGLGLSLAREIVLAHKGRLRLDTAADNLITFSISLPCRN
jgi:two-component system, OmpR family, heavy metal sensor histidine kinase CusS